MSRERPNQPQICPFSICSGKPTQCVTESCEAWKTNGQECSFSASATAISYNIFRLAAFAGLEAKKDYVGKLARPRDAGRARRPNAYDQGQEDPNDYPNR